MVDRPRTVNGATSFHFSYIPISKEALPTVNGAPVEGSFGKVKSAALEHSKYIERDGAAERSAGAQHAGYIERDGAVEHIDDRKSDVKGKSESVSVDLGGRGIIKKQKKYDKIELDAVDLVNQVRRT